ncbi:MAG TPA: hypothetical protein P5092_06265 [Ruminococcus sp.]|nr:hypothetical protein [Ruminococcus sp.]
MNNIKKATAAIAAAALCAVSALSTSLTANAATAYKYTYRHVYAARNTAPYAGIKINSISLTYKVKNKYDLGTLSLSGPGRFFGTFSNAGGYEIFTGNWGPNATFSNQGEVLFSLSTQAQAADFNYNSYVINMSFSGTVPKHYPSTAFLDPFIVGDINGDKQVNDSDYWEMKTAVDAGKLYASGRSVKSDLTNVSWHGRTLGRYQYDINNDGQVNNSDLVLLGTHRNGYANAGKPFQS